MADLHRRFSPSHKGLALLCAIGLAGVAAPSLAIAQEGTPTPPSPAIQHSGSQATVNAMLLGGAISPTRPLSIVLYDDSNTDLAIQSELEAALIAAGYTIDGNASLELSFQTDVASAKIRPRQRNALGLTGTVGSDSDPKLRGHVTLYADDQNGVLLAEIPPKSSEGGPFLRLEMDLTDRDQGGKRVWQGWATANIPERSVSETARAMVPHMVAQLGQTVREAVVVLK